MLAACSGNGGGTGMGAAQIGKALMLNGLLVTAAHPGINEHPGSPLWPDSRKAAKNSDQYISNFDDNKVLQFDYPKADSSIGDIGDVEGAQGTCTSNGEGTFWVTASRSDEIEEFKFGGTSPVKTLSESTGEPASCAIDPTSGNMAVTILSDGDVILFTKAGGRGSVMSTPLIEAYFDGYDPSGNLWADGFDDDDAFALIELPKGSSSFKSIAISNSIGFPGAVQWDGTYVTVNDQDARDIYGYTCSGTSCTLERTTALSGSSDCVGTWIVKGLVYCPDAGNNEGEVYKYPAGGSPIATLTGHFDLPISAMQVAK
jgi:hypothetical protein